MGFEISAELMPLAWLFIGTAAFAASPFIIAWFIKSGKRKKPPKYPQATKPFRKILDNKN